VTMAAGSTEIPHSGPYDLMAWNANQKIFDYRPDWWAVKAGRIAEPAVKRIIIANITGVSMDTVAQRLVNNEFDSALDMRSSVIGNILAQNPEITTHTGNESPFGYLDWWPNSLWMNTQLEPYSDVRVRRAISLAINRDAINDVLYDGAKIATIYPFPLYPNLQAFADSAAVKALEEKYQPGKFDTEESAKLMTEAGFTLNGDGLWEKDGKTVDATIQGFENIHGDIVPVLVEMLRQAGFDAAINFGPDAYQNMADGKAGLYMFGHGASLYDPFEALNLFHGKYSANIGTAAGNSRWSRYKNPEFDAILDKIAPLSSDDPAFQAGAAEALGIYWRDQIDVPIIQWLHRIAYNQHYWKNWPTAASPAMGTNGAFWAQTGTLVITSLQPTGAQ
jgi:peptide/nickel transport system substrate-binding protein